MMMRAARRGDLSWQQQPSDRRTTNGQDRNYNAELKFLSRGGATHAKKSSQIKVKIIYNQTLFKHKVWK